MKGLVQGIPSQRNFSRLHLPDGWVLSQQVARGAPRGLKIPATLWSIRPSGGKVFRFCQ